MATKIRVLHVVTVMDVGGIETTIMNYMRHLDQTQVQFDFLVHRDKAGYFDEEIRSLGGTIYYAPAFTLKNISKYSKFINQFFKENRFDIVHSHIDSLSYFPLKGAMNNGIKVRIAHSHVNGFDKNITYPIRTFFKKMIPLSANYFMACSDSAGKFMFGNRPFEVLLNPIDIDKFAFNQIMRDELRTELDIGDQILIGHVGRFGVAKNHRFILDLASKLDKNKYHFLLIGAGDLKGEIETSAKAQGITNITFLGIKNNVYDYLSAMDIFILPSFYEGLGIVAIEAQVNGLPVLVSNHVSTNVAITEQVQFIPLDKTAWSEAIELIQFNNRAVMNDSIQEYDIQINANKLLQDYLTLVEESK